MQSFCIFFSKPGSQAILKQVSKAHYGEEMAGPDFRGLLFGELIFHFFCKKARCKYTSVISKNHFCQVWFVSCKWCVTRNTDPFAPEKGLQIVNLFRYSQLDCSLWMSHCRYCKLCGLQWLAVDFMFTSGALHRQGQGLSDNQFPERGGLLIFGSLVVRTLDMIQRYWIISHSCNTIHF